MLNNLDVDLLITGEFNHDEILHEVQRKITVILTDHTNTERGHHSQFREKFTNLLKSNNEHVELLLSEIDRDPLEPT
jgi:putative NIF3 family GTP cyclohydrolase 1 type 2